MPPLDERLALAERTMTALVADAELPPKIGVHPRPDGSFAHAMPAAPPAGATPAATTADDLLGMKWVTGFPANRTAGLAGRSTRRRHPQRPGHRPADRRSSTAARSPPSGRPPCRGVAIRAVRRSGAGAARGAIDRRRRPGPRATSRSSAASCPASQLVVHDRHPDRAAALAERPPDRRDRRRGADPPARPSPAPTSSSPPSPSPGPRTARSMTGDWLRPRRARRAGRLRDDVLGRGRPRRRAVPGRRPRPVPGQPRRRPVRRLPGPDDDHRRGDPRRDAATAAGRVVVTHLGVGLADVVFGDAIVRRAAALGLGHGAAALTRGSGRAPQWLTRAAPSSAGSCVVAGRALVARLLGTLTLA